MQDKYIKELVTEMFFEATDLMNGNSFKEIGYDSKHDYFEELKSRLEQLEERLVHKGIILNDEDIVAEEVNLAD